MICTQTPTLIFIYHLEILNEFRSPSLLFFCNHIYMYKQRRFRAFWKNCAEQKNCLFLCCKPVLKTLVKSEGLLEEPWKGGLGCQKTSFHEYFPYSKCLLKVQSTQSWSHGASVWGLIHQPTPFRLLILLVF